MPVLRLQILAAFAVALVVLPPASAAGFAPRTGHRKVVIEHPRPQSHADAAALLHAGGAGVVEHYDSYTVGYARESALPGLMRAAAARNAGITVYDDFDTIALPGGTIDARIGTAASNPGRTLSRGYAEGETGLFLVQFAGPVRSHWKDAVRTAGATVVQYVRHNGYIVAATPRGARAIGDLAPVQFVDVLHPFLKPRPPARPTGQVTDTYVQLARTDGVEDAIGEIAVRSLRPVQRSDRTNEILLEGAFDAADIEILLAHPLVFGVADVPRVGFSDERVAMSVTRNAGASGLPANPGTYKQWLAELCPYCGTLADDGFAVAFADTGLDEGICDGAAHHADLPGSRVRYGSSFDPADPECLSPADTPSRKDLFGHGTAVASIAAGNPPAGAASDSGGFIAGMGVAPSAGIFMTKAYLPNNGAPTPVHQLATDARITPAAPVYIQSHSYNEYTLATSTTTCAELQDGRYSITSRNFDFAVRDANLGGASVEPITLVVSAGNKHQQPPELAHCSDVRLTLPPATAKNVIAVGGTESVRGPSEQGPCGPGYLATRAESFSNIMGDSKRGTVTPGWYKPDLMAPASLLYVAKAFSTGPAQSPCPYPLSFNLPEYYVGVGTSYAAPAVAAAAVLASRVYAERVAPGCQGSGCNAGAASPALLKAMLIMSTRSMRNGDDRAIAPQWKASTPYAAGAVVIPTAGNGHVYKATTGGTSGAAEPANWPASGSVTDNQVTWTRDSSSLIGPYPNGQQGFGRLHLEDLLDAYPARDYVNEAYELDSSQSREFTYNVHDPARPVKVVLTWTDEAALQGDTTPLVNDLDLVVEPGTSCTTRYAGNHFTVANESRGEESDDESCSYATYDRANNVEAVKFFPQVTGTTQFKVRVTAFSATDQKFALAVYNAYSAAAGAIAPPAAPGAFRATASTPTEVGLSWNAVTGATGYEVQRKSAGGYFVTIASPASAPSAGAPLANAVAADTGYLYRVRARNAAGVSAWSYDFAATLFYPGDVAVRGSRMKPIHLTRVLEYVNKARAAVGLGTSAFSSSPASRVRVTVDRLNQLRSALNAALAAAGATFTYTDAAADGTLPRGTRIKAVHIEEIRSALQ